MFHSRGIVQSKTYVPRRYLMYLQCDVRLDFAQCLSYAITGDAAANGIYPGGKREDFFANVLSDNLFADISWKIHYVAQTALCLTSRRYGGRGVALVQYLRVPQMFIEDPIRQQFLDVADTLVPWPLELRQCQARSLVGFVELLGPHAASHRGLKAGSLR